MGRGRSSGGERLTQDMLVGKGEDVFSAGFQIAKIMGNTQAGQRGLRWLGGGGGFGLGLNQIILLIVAGTGALAHAGQADV